MLSNLRKQTIRKWIIGIFVTVPIISSLISAIHLVDLFQLGNYTWQSYLLSAAFEVGSIAAFLILGVLPNIHRWMIWSVFFLLAGMQIIGNIFFSYDFVFRTLITTPSWLDSFNSFMGYFTGNDPNTNKMILSFLVGLPIPLISLFFLKSLVDYLKLDDDSLKKDQEVIQSKEEPIQPKIVQEKKFKFTEPIKQEFKNLEVEEVISENVQENVQETVQEPEVPIKEKIETPIYTETEPIKSIKELEKETTIVAPKETLNPAIMQNNNIK